MMHNDLLLERVWTLLVLTVVGRVVIARTDELLFGKKRHQLLRPALVHAVSIDDRIQFVEHLKDQRAGLVDGAHNRMTLRSKFFQ